MCLLVDFKYTQWEAALSLNSYFGRTYLKASYDLTSSGSYSLSNVLTGHNFSSPHSNSSLKRLISA